MRQSSIAGCVLFAATWAGPIFCGSRTLAQAPGQALPQNYPAAQGYPSPQNYPANNQSAPSAGGNPQAQDQPTGQYPPRTDQPAGPSPYPTIQQRQPAGNSPVYGPQPPVYGPQPPAYGQDPRLQGPAESNQSGPTARPAAPSAPFVLSPQEEAVLDRVLNDWEKRNKEIHTLESKFLCWKYDGVFGNGNGNQPPAPDEGELKFAAPDKGLFLLKNKQADQWDQWICDGRSIFKFNYKETKVIEYVLPPELQGKAIADGPLPFVFCTEAQKLKQRYFMKIITPPTVTNEVWLEAYPRFQQQAAEFKKVEVILQIGGQNKGLLPFAIQLYDPSGKSRTVYQLQDPVVNPRGSWLPQIGSDWWKPSVPFTWKKEVQLPPQPVQAQGPRTAMGMQR